MNEQTVIKETHAILDAVCDMLELSKWNNGCLLDMKTLREELNAPCVLAVAGKVKAGKSFLINSLLGVDLAMTGNTETTATINVFKKGKPFSKEQPVLCQWMDGRREWKGKDFLYSLQGTDDDTLKLTAQIDRLIFYVEDNSMLEEVTLVDTPGIGADVGDDGDAHQVQTDAYFQLRKRHEESSVSHSNSADAIIYLFNTVPTETDKSFLSMLHDNGHGVTSLNGIGVLSKVDRDLGQLKNVDKFAKDFEKELFGILPTSAALTKLIPSKPMALQLADTLREWFPTQAAFNMAIASEKSFCHPKLPKCMVSAEERKGMVDRCVIAKDVPWSVFAMVARELYDATNAEEAIDKLNDIAGIEKLRKQINEHFFKRSRLLRCNKVLGEMRKLLLSIKYEPAFLMSAQYAKCKEQLQDACEDVRPPYRDMMRKLIDCHVDSMEKVEQEQQALADTLLRIDDLLSSLSEINNSYIAYRQVLASRGEFAHDELDELRVLFSGQEVSVDSMDRYRYWSSVANTACQNSTRQVIAKIAKAKYVKVLESNG